MTRRTALAIAIGSLVIVLLAIVIAIVLWPELPARTLPAPTGRP